ncbi:hypothetical protein BN135_964 [Cronobacter muytjensii 530]
MCLNLSFRRFISLSMHGCGKSDNAYFTYSSDCDKGRLFLAW